MRFLELRLERFGPFTGVTLDLSAEGGAVHLIHGRNEAGKSTALRALSGLLFGIPLRTADAHVHPMASLRVGCRLRTADGRELELVRLKKKIHSLQDGSGEPVGEEVLRSILNGMGEEHFRATFGLDHERLRAGAEALLAGGGDVGESLFDAGTGGRGIHGVLARLEQEAEAIFTPRASKRLLNDAVRAFKEAKEARREAATRASTWSEQEAGLAAAQAERDHLAELRRALLSEQGRLQRLMRTLPLVARREDLRTRREGLGGVTSVPASAREERLEAQRARAEGLRDAERTEREIASLEAESAAHDFPEALAAVAEESMDALHDRLGSHRKEVADLPKREGELESLQQLAAQLLAQIDPERGLSDAGALRIDVGAQARIRALSSERSGLEADLAHAESQWEQRSERLGRARARLAALPAPLDVVGLEQATAAAGRLGETEERRASLTATVQAARMRAEDARSNLAPWRGTAEELTSTTFTALETTERFAEQLDAIGRQERELGERRGRAGERMREVEREMAAQEGSGDIPTEAQLDAARTTRDGLWEVIRRRLEGAEATDGEEPRLPPENPDPNAFEEAVGRADSVADRLRREAERVTRHAHLLAERDALRSTMEEIDTRAGEVQVRRTDAERDWIESWRASGLTPTSPAEMRGFHVRLADARRLSTELGAAATELDAWVGRAADAAEGIRSALAALHADPEEADASLPAALSRAATLLDTQRALRDARAQLEGEIETLAGEVGEHERRRRDARRRLTEWREAWALAVAAIGLGADARPEEAEVVLARLVELHAKLDDAERVRGRIERMRENAGRFGAEVDGLLAVHAPELATRPLDERAETLLRRHRQAREEARVRRRILESLEEKRRDLSRFREQASDAEGRLARLLEAAGVESVEALEEAERRSLEAARLDGEREDLDRGLFEAGDGLGSEALLAEARDVQATEVRVRLHEIEEELKEQDEKLREVSQRVGQLEQGIAQLRGRTGAAVAATEAESQLARIREQAHRYVRLRLSAQLLRAELERYREEHQGPVLSRAGELFPRLTLGAYGRLKVGIGDGEHSVLRCVRADGEEVGVEALSDGTRDQLYLALRIASLERYARDAEPMPLILDDALIHFDDERARAALSVLGELAETTQVLFFTHHARLAELAREAIPPERLRPHDLDAARRHAAPQPSASRA